MDKEFHKAKKLYFWEEGLRRALTLDMDDGKEAENIAAWHLIKKGRESKPFFEPYYWKNKHEVDFVYSDLKKVIPVEIKYREHPANADLKGLIEFMEMEDLNNRNNRNKRYLQESRTWRMPSIVYSDMAFLTADMNVKIPFVYFNPSLIHYIYS